MAINVARRTWRTTMVLAIGLTVGLGLPTGSVAQDSVYDPSLFELGDGQPPPGMPGMANILQDSAQAGPDWASLFAVDGTPRDEYPFDANGDPLGNGIPDYRELFGGQWAIFASDYVSLGSGFEGSALTSEGGVVNSVVSPDHDLGNAYVYSKVGPTGNLFLYAGVERLGSGASLLEIELNQDVFRLGHGGYGRNVPWTVLGQTMAGDLKVVVNFTGAGLGAVDVRSWDGGAWVPVESFTGEGCSLDERFCAVSNAGLIDGGPWVNYDTGGDPEQISAGRFLELGINVTGLTGAQPAFKTVRLKTPQDVDFGYFEEGGQP